MYSTNLRLAIAIHKYLVIGLILLGFLSSLLAICSLKLAVSRIQQPQPQAILILGGSQNREVFAARFARKNAKIPIWLSSGAKNLDSRQKFRDWGISSDRVYIDNRATDTVTNFTTLVNDFEEQNIKHLYVVTSDYHMARSSAIATVILGSRGIAFTPLSVVEGKTTEPNWKILRDTIRALIWLFTGYTGANLDRW